MNGFGGLGWVRGFVVKLYRSENNHYFFFFFKKKKKKVSQKTVHTPRSGCHMDKKKRLQKTHFAKKKKKKKEKKCVYICDRYNKKEKKNPEENDLLHQYRIS